MFLCLVGSDHLSDKLSYFTTSFHFAFAFERQNAAFLKFIFLHQRPSNDTKPFLLRFLDSVQKVMQRNIKSEIDI